MSGCVREQLMALVLAARNDVREARIELGATPPPIARAPDTVPPPHTTTQPMLRLVVASASARRA
jgi:hypothetical protein